MIKSMTAYATASLTRNRTHVDVEIRSYNSKNLDVALYLPKTCYPFEEDIKKQVAGRISRGRVEIRISMENTLDETVAFEVNESRAAAYYQALVRLKDQLALDSEITLEMVLNGHDMILPGQEEAVSLDDVRDVMCETVDTAVDALDAMRSAEGVNLVSDLESRLNVIEEGLSRVSGFAGAIPDLYRQKLMDRIGALTNGVDGIDPVRLAQEAAFLADKSDITEELVRANSHIKQFRETLDMDEPTGRKLNFLIQEFHREFNTMGSKAGKAELSHVIVDLKSELEKIREQIQNIE